MLGQWLQSLLKLFTSNFPTLAAQDFAKRKEATPKALYVDVRTSGEHASGHIKGSVHIDVQSRDFKARIAKLDREREYFVYCASGGRSRMACMLMSAQGLKVHNLAGGFSAWKSAQGGRR